MRHNHAAAVDAAHGQSSPAPVPAAVEALKTTPRPERSDVLVPVEIQGVVSTLNRPSQTWETFQVPLSTAAPTPIANKQDTRRSITLCNLDGANSAFIGPRTDVSGTNGYCLKPGASITLTTRGAIQGVSTVATVIVAVLAEYEDGVI